MSSKVRNRIASFEAHNEELRKATSPNSAASSSPCASPLRREIASASGGGVGNSATSGSNVVSPYSISPNKNATQLAGQSPRSEMSPSQSITAAASQSRINRLQRQTAAITNTNNSSINDPQTLLHQRKTLRARRLLGVPAESNQQLNQYHQQQLNSSSSRSRSPVAPATEGGGPGASLFAHRRAPDPINTSINSNTTTASGKTSPYTNKATELSKRQMIMQPKLEHSSQSSLDGRSSNKLQQEMNNQQSNRSSRLGKIQRIKKMRSNMHTKSQNSDSEQEQEQQQQQQQVSEEDVTDSTLTSVRQLIVDKRRQSKQNSSTPTKSSSSPGTPQHDERVRMDSPNKHQQLMRSNNSTPNAVNNNNNNNNSYNNKTQHQWTLHHTDDGEEKSEKQMPISTKTASTPTSSHAIHVAQSSSSDYDTEGDPYHQHHNFGGDPHGIVPGPSMSASQMTPDVGLFFNRTGRQGAGNTSSSSNYNNKGAVAMNNTNKEDDDTYDYSGRDDEDGHVRVDSYPINNGATLDSPRSDGADSHGSMSYTQRREKEAKAKEAKARKRAAAAAKAGMENPYNVGVSGFQKEDVERYRKIYDTPTARTALGVAVAATVGSLVLGPVGLLVGAAAVGIGVGVMQIPEEQRSNMCEKAGEAVRGAQETAMQASEALSASCANTYHDSGIEEHVPQEMKSCCTAIDEEVKKVQSSTNVGSMSIMLDAKNLHERGGSVRGGVGGGDRVEGGGGGGGVGYDNVPGAESLGNKGKDGHSSSPNRFGNKKDNVACLREGKIIPVSQIHALDPGSQPRAWLDVLASAETNHDEKMEAMEEILILAKDKQRARIFLEEGILDSIMWMLGRYFEKLERLDQNNTNNGDYQWANPEITPEEASAARLSATCCLTLGKSHCAAIHTGGDLLLMSMYERGTVPEERQLAQMLHEVPFHSRITQTDDPTIVDPGNENFALKQMSLPQAEELAQKIKAVADLRI